MAEIYGRIQFDSGEHEALGNKLILHYSDSQEPGDVLGRDFNYAVGSLSLSYGKIVALAGDFYGNAHFKMGDVEQISDNWDTDPEKSIARALENAKKLSSDDGGYLKCIVNCMDAQKKEVEAGIASGQDPAQVFVTPNHWKYFNQRVYAIVQVYNSTATKYNLEYTKCTNGLYPLLAMCNWDHFGTDAIKAYSAVHTAALRQAKVAHDSGKHSDLKQAYFLEGFAQHFLTDLFSTGHMRAPRRILHKTLFGSTPEPKLPEYIYPADFCAEKMHDEDCANGLWVSNQLGESWAAYGDKQLWSGKSSQNFVQALSAAQAGITEVWSTKDTGNIPPAEEFKALKMMPNLENLNTSNFVPLFRWNSTKPDELFLRARIDARNDARTETIQAKQSILAWKALFNKIKQSGQDKNMYPFTKAFVSQTNVLHFRKGAGDSDLTLNSYGPVDSGSYGTFWSVRSQSIVSVPHDVGDLSWITATNLGGGVLSLVGRLKLPNSTTIHARHIGLKVNGNPIFAKNIWSTSIDDENSYWTEGDTSYGAYSVDTSAIGMVKYWSRGPRGASKLELWTISGSLDVAPEKNNLNWPVNSLNYMLPYQIQSDDSYSTFVGCGYNQSKSNTTWYFSTWKNGYSSQILTEIEEAVTFPAQALLSGKFGTSDKGSRIVRIFYGPSYPSNNEIRIDIMNPSRNASTGKIKPDFSTKTQVFPVTWPRSDPKDYLIWFLADVNNNNMLDLVTLILSPSFELSVIVFPGKSDLTFAGPVVSIIKLDPLQGTLLNAEFMKPLVTSQGQYTYPQQTNGEGPIISYAAILAGFDNYGILGIRILAPIIASGMFTYNYELKGQTPAIAGQPSAGLGETGEDWMGRGQRTQEIGFFFDWNDGK